MKFTKVGDTVFRDGQPVTWQDIRQETGLPRNLARLALKKLVERGDEVVDLKAWCHENLYPFGNSQSN
jgi:hypothetical protein